MSASLGLCGFTCGLSWGVFWVRLVSGPCTAGSVSPLHAPSRACLAVCIVDSGLSGLPSEWGCSPGGRQHNCSRAVSADVCAHLQFLLASSLSFLSVILCSLCLLTSYHPAITGAWEALMCVAEVGGCTPGLGCHAHLSTPSPRWACARGAGR